MKQKLLMPLFATALMLTGCHTHEGNEASNPKEEALKNATVPYVEEVVIPTYRQLADETVDLYQACQHIFAQYESGCLSETDVKDAAAHWEAARKNWELSEAFLYGPAANHNIDPHIDSWPLDRDAMEAMLGNEVQMKQIEEQGADYVGEKLGYGLLGFHAIEYMLYDADNNDKANVRTRDIHKYTRAELVYLVAVAEDLMIQTTALEASWAGVGNLSASKQAILRESETEYNDFADGYGNWMKNAGQPGSLYKTYQEVAEELIQGCIDIADEVGNTKIGTPANASSAEDRNYIESPYSLNSIADFQDNIRSIRNSYMGVNGKASVYTYIKSVHPELAETCLQEIDGAIAAIAAIPEPFALHATGPEAQKAVKIVGTDLVNMLQEVYNELGK